MEEKRETRTFLLTNRNLPSGCASGRELGCCVDDEVGEDRVENTRSSSCWCCSYLVVADGW